MFTNHRKQWQEMELCQFCVLDSLLILKWGKIWFSFPILLSTVEFVCTDIFFEIQSMNFVKFIDCLFDGLTNSQVSTAETNFHKSSVWVTEPDWKLILYRNLVQQTHWSPSVYFITLVHSPILLIINHKIYFRNKTFIIHIPSQLLGTSFFHFLKLLIFLYLKI